MLYTQKGLRTNELHPVHANSLDDALRALSVCMPAGADIQQFKQTCANYFIAGEIEPHNGQCTRNNESVKKRDALVLDIDTGLEAGTTAKDIAQAFDCMCYVYPTISHTMEKPRYRVVIPCTEAITPTNYTYNIQKFIEQAPFTIDPSSKKWAQLMGAPVMKSEEDTPFYKQEGEIFKPYTLPALEDKKTTPAKPEETQDTPEAIQVITDEEAISIVRAYADQDAQNLQVRDNYLSALFVLVRAVQRGEISHGAGLECAVLLAGDNAEWKTNNAKHFESELRRADVHTDKTFLEKFDHSGVSRLLLEPIEAPAEGKQNPEATPEQTKQKGRILPPPPTISIWALLKKDIKPRKEVIHGIMGEGLVILAGAPKAGKSLLALDMALAIASGGDVLGAKTEQAGVFYFALEDGEARIKERALNMLKARGAENSAGEFNLWTYTSDPEDPRFDALLQYDLKIRQQGSKYRGDPTKDLIAFLQLQKEDVIFLDVFQKVREGSNGSNLYESEYAEITELQRFAIENHKTVILIHHFKKGTAGMEMTERISGSSAVAGCADVIITLERLPQRASNEIRCTLKMTSRDFKDTDRVLQLNPLGYWEYIGNADELKEEEKREEEDLAFNTNIWIEVIRRGVTENNGEWETTATEIQERAKELRETPMCLWDYPNGEAIDVRYIKKIQDDLYKREKIAFSHKNTNAKRIYTFKQCG